MRYLLPFSLAGLLIGLVGCVSDNKPTTTQPTNVGTAKPAATAAAQPHPINALSQADSAQLKNDISAMEQGLQTGNFAAIAKRTYAPLVASQGGQTKFQNGLKRAFTQAQQRGVKILGTRYANPQGLYETPAHLVYLIPKETIIQTPKQHIGQRAYLIAVKDKSRGQWSYLDGSGFAKNPNAAKKVLPNAPESLNLPPIQARKVTPKK